MNTSQTRGQVLSSTGQTKIQNTSLPPSNVLPRKKSSIFDRSADASRTPLNVQVNRVVEYEKDARLSSLKTVGTVTTGQQPASTNSGGLQTPSDPRLQKKPSRSQLIRKKSSQALRKVAEALGQAPPLPKDAHTVGRK